MRGLAHVLARRPRQHRFGRRRSVAQGAVRPDRIVVAPPALDQKLCLLQRIEDFPVQQFVPQLAVEALVVAILPRAAGLDEQRRYAEPGKPATHDLSHELGPIVGADVTLPPGMSLV